MLFRSSPHEFEQFDLSKIGTGEGAQSYGHGLYFAQAEPTAKKYRDALSGRNAYVIDHILEHAPELRHLRTDVIQDLRRWSNADQYDPMTAAKWAQNENRELRGFDQSRIANVLASHRNAAKGHMYEVNINAHPDHLLEWEKPLSEQSEYIKNILSGHPAFERANFVGEPIDRGLRNKIFAGDAVRKERAEPKEISDYLHSLGIKGIKYLDAGSRGATDNPTHNYVIFDDKLINVKRRYEQGGRVGYDIGGPVAPIAPQVPDINAGYTMQDVIRPYDPTRDANLQAAEAEQRYYENEKAKQNMAATQEAEQASNAAIMQSEGGGGSGEGVGGGPGAGATDGPSGASPGGGRDSSATDSTGTTGGNAGDWRKGGRILRNTGGPVNVSKAEDTAGNYKKEHEKIHGIPVSVEVKRGHDRVKYNPDGSVKFKAKQYADYGAILGTKDADGMDTDVMVGPHKDSEKAYIVDQRKHKTGKFDEHKVLLGFKKRKKAIKAYTKSYADRHGKERVQDVVKTDIGGLKKWLKHGNLKQPAAKIGRAHV